MIVETWDLMIVVLGIGKEETLMKFDVTGDDGYGRRPVKKVERRLMVWRLVDKPMIKSLDFSIIFEENLRSAGEDEAEEGTLSRECGLV